MRFFNLPKNTNIKIVRENYVKEFKVTKELRVEPCEKFVAIFEKLSKNYALALRDNASIETLQIANQNDIEFYEGYELAPHYTESVRLRLARSAYSIYNILGCIVAGMDRLEKNIDNGKKSIINDIKLNINVINNIISNIYQHITMTNDNINFDGCGDIPSGVRELIEYIKMLIGKAINELIGLIENTTIEYILRQAEIIIQKLYMYLASLVNM